MRRVRQRNRRWLGLGLAALIGVGGLAACNFGRRDEQTQPAAQPTSAGAVNQLTQLPPGVTEAPTQSIESSASPTGTLTATSEADSLANDLDKDLDELDGLNATADPLEDEP